MLTVNSITDIKLKVSLLNGGIVVIPTDTVYGLAARAKDQAAVGCLYNLKNREAKPGTIIAASVEHLVDLGMKRRYLKAVEHLWPGAISVVVPSGFGLGYLDQGKGSLAVRIVANPELVLLLEQTGPLLTSSANLTGKAPANTIDEAMEYFGDRIDVYADGGNLSGRAPSTIIRIVDDAIEILRPGAVKINERGETTEMKFDEYQKQAIGTALNPARDFNALMYRTLGLVGEAGEIAEKVKKILRDKDGKISAQDKQEIIKELGDVLWYLQSLADIMEVPLSVVAEKNLEKIHSRKARGVTKGSGDNR